jgi:hypothetical protein
MLGFGKKLILVIFTAGLLVSNVLAVEPTLSGNYIFSLVVRPPSRAVSVPVIFQAKITPDKSGGRIDVTRSSSNADGAFGVEGDSYTFAKTKNGITIFLPLKNRGISPSVATGVDCNSDDSKLSDPLHWDADVYFTNLDSKKVARQAVIYGEIEKKLTNLFACGVPIEGKIIPNQNQKVTVEVSGILIKQ